MKTVFLYLSVAALMFSLVGESKGGEVSLKDKNNPMEAVLKEVAKKKIYFGHQSVGFNIIDGISDILKETQDIPLNIVKTNSKEAFKSPIFAHYTVGENDDTVSKVNGFARAMDSGIGGNVDIAFFKFCYIDIHKTTDVEKLFLSYKEAMGRLVKIYPKTRFIHVTAPLTVSKTSVKSFIKKLIGKEDNNIKRNLFNERLIQEYSGKEPVFDLAKIESTFADERRSSFTSAGKAYYSLVPEYTDDGGHLNEKGRKMVAMELLRFLASVQ